MPLNPLSFISDIFGKIADKVAPDKGKILEAQSRINEQEAGAGGIQSYPTFIHKSKRKLTL